MKGEVDDDLLSDLKAVPHPIVSDEATDNRQAFAARGHT